MIRQGAPTGNRRKPREWELRLELERRERDRRYRELMAELREARESKAEWYMWVLNGRPTLTASEYARVGKLGNTRNRRPDSPRDRGEEAASMAARDGQETLA